MNNQKKLNRVTSSAANSAKTSAAAPGTLAVLGACLLAQHSAGAADFGDDLAFLQEHTDVIVLSDRAGMAKVAVAPSWQGRVLTSSAEGDAGASFGWINRDLITSGKIQPHINVFGGEDRFWLGPEGGQFSIFFAKGVPFDLEHWFTPAPLDTEPFKLVRQGRSRAEFTHSFGLTNYSGTHFEVAVDRTVELLSPRSSWRHLALPEDKSVHLVGFESINRLKNAGNQPWRKDSGLLSIWILGMYNPAPATTIVIPFKPGPESELGPIVNANYFGPVPSDRLVVTDNTVFFSADGKYRSKIGINPRRCRGVLGSYDAAHQVLTIVQFTFHPGQTNYVNSMWELQKHPYSGDVANSYNDGPPTPGAKPLGPFFEMESSSAAAELAPGKVLEHIHRTFHLTGPEPALDAISQKLLGVGLQEIATALPKEK